MESESKSMKAVPAIAALAMISAFREGICRGAMSLKTGFDDPYYRIPSARAEYVSSYVYDVNRL